MRVDLGLVARRGPRTRAASRPRAGGRRRRRRRRGGSPSLRRSSSAVTRPSSSVGDRAAASSWSRCRRRRVSAPACGPSGDLVGHRPAVERGEQVVDREGRHPLPRGVGRRADVGGDDQVGRAQQRVVGRQRLGIGDVERGAGDRRRCAAPRVSAAWSTIGPRAVLMRIARRRICRQRGRVDQVVGLGRQRAVQRDEVRALRAACSSGDAAVASRCGSRSCRSPRPAWPRRARSAPCR